MKKILIIIAVLAIGGGFFAYQMYNKPHKDMTSAESDLAISSTDLLAAFESDETSANDLYNDKVVAVTGNVLSVSNEEGITKVTLDAGNPLGGVICQLDELSDHERTSFEEGESVTFKGLCTGYLMDVVLVRCVEVK
ncbi:MAG: hypothetical protein KDC24_09320 [Saprospiraceae bacterium]|nr:hypothetical protein [Saprospiraceae bacterium]